MTSPWEERLAALLAYGAPLDKAVAQCVQSDAPAESVERRAREFLGNPLFRVASLAAHRLRSRDWLLRVYASLGDLAGSGSIDIRNSLTRDEFVSNYYAANRPVLLRQVAAEWRAVRLWTRDYLSHICGDALVEVMMGRTGAPISDQNTSDRLRRQMLFEDFASLVYMGGRSNDYYLVSRNKFFENENTRLLLDDLGPLPFVNTRATGGGVKMWFGPGGTVTPLHHDDRNNLIVQIVGRKDIRLYPAYCAEHMRQTQEWYAGVDPGGSADTQAEVASRELHFPLNPGDALFIPAGWWHALVAEDVSITLAFVDFGIPNEYGWP